MQRDPNPPPLPSGLRLRPDNTVDAPSHRVSPPTAAPTHRHDHRVAPAVGVPESHTARAGRRPLPDNRSAPSTQQHHQHPLSNRTSQDTSTTNDTDPVFTPPISEGGMSPGGGGSARDSSQESQLMQLSNAAAARERIPESSSDDSTDAGGTGHSSKKRMADGVVKSPVRMGGHSRNTSTVSMASTTGSRIGELSAELKARLSYAMVKVNHGWQAHNIDQIETLASHGGSPTSSNSTIHLRTASSASPQLSSASQRGSNNTTPATGLSQQFPPRLNESAWRDPRFGGSPTSPVKAGHSLAPPVSIQPSHYHSNPRRNSNIRHTPTLLSQQASPNPGPNTPGHPSPYPNTAAGAAGAPQRTPVVDPMLFSPHQNVREKDAIESLLFMSSPGNSANLKHAFPSSSQPLPQRTALPTSQPRKSLPTGRRPMHARSQSHTQKRVGFERSPNDMDIDDAAGGPPSRGTPRRKMNANGGYGQGEAHLPPSRLKPLPVSSGLTVPPRPRTVLRDADIDRMLDRVTAAADSDSDGEIEIPVPRARRDGAPAVGA
ncbi:cell cycle transcriptional repressor whi5 [Podospora conica]|nr:cell cycle transcriptional repressor whi5 [Schizothecium conicum]